MIIRSSLLETLKNKPWTHIITSLFSTLFQIPTSSRYDTVVSANIAMNRHCKNGRLEIARQLFDETPQRTVISWNTMICGYAKWEKYDEALSLVSTMHKTDARLNETTFSKILSACARSRSFDEGTEIHCLALKSRAENLDVVGCALCSFYSSFSRINDAEMIFVELRDRNDLIWSVMLAGYVQCKKFEDAVKVFDEMPKREVVAWTSLISGYAKTDEGDDIEKGLKLFKRMMISDEAIPNEFTFDCVIRSFGKLGFFAGGKSVHGLMIKHGVEFDRLISATLIEFYCRFENVDCAKRVYGMIRSPCSNASSSLINGLVSLQRIEEAEIVYNKLEEKDLVSSNLMIKAYSETGRVEESEKLFEKMTKKSVVSFNMMITAYFENREIEKARSLFEKISDRDRDHITWNSTISGFVRNHLHDEALKLYSTMRRFSVHCTRSTFSVILRSCSCLGSLRSGRAIHAHLVKTSLESNVYVGTSLLDMYSKCGSVIEARESFESISSPNVRAWTSLVNGLGIHGLGSIALDRFREMSKLGILPNGATFLAILCACRYSGLTLEGLEIFVSMQRDHKVKPGLEHYACLVDLLGRAGKIREAFDLIEGTKLESDGVVLGALLSACWFWSNLKLAEKLAEKMLGLDPKPVFAYNILANIYAGLGKWGESVRARERMKDFGAKRVFGCSWIELNSKVHVFCVEDKTRSCSDSALSALKNLNANMINFSVEIDGQFDSQY